MHWLVTATLSSPLAGDPPMLDAILEWQMASVSGRLHALQRHEECPPVGEIHIPCLRGEFGGCRGIPRCSSPILDVASETGRHDHFAKRLAVEHADMLRENQRLVVATGNATYKSYRLPLHVRQVNRIAWFVGGSKRRSLKSLLDHCQSIGKKRSQGYGRITSWDIMQVEHDWSWFAPTEHGTLLMRILPACDELPKDMIGYRRDFCGLWPPYWHPDRFTECVVPC